MSVILNNCLKHGTSLEYTRLCFCFFLLCTLCIKIAHVAAHASSCKLRPAMALCCLCWWKVSCQYATYVLSVLLMETQEMVESVTASGAKVLLLPLLENSLQLRYEPLREGQRRVLNHMMRSYVGRQQAAGSTQLYSVDLYPWLPYYAMSAKDRAEYWSDGTHPSPRGYDLMGYRIFLAIKQYMKPSMQVQASSDIP